MKTIDLEAWRGKRDEIELDPSQIEFRAHQSPKTCNGCLFAGQWAKVCDKAAEQARLRYLPDCESGWIYKIIERDPRQLAISEVSA